MSETKFVNGLFVDPPSENAPDFVKAKLSIKVDRFIDWLQEAETTPKGYCQIDILESREGKLYAKENTWKPDNAHAEGSGKAVYSRVEEAHQAAREADEDLPF